ncbi:MAG: Stp1/IreP family PP2C-type Ser/Thr phosphatase [bacterium]|jgi:serine/threonine protein phosphatase PrpC
MLTWSGSHIGRVRELNEDSYYIWCSGETGFFMVADGMGGHQAGEVASKLAIDTLRNYIETFCFDVPTTANIDYSAIMQKGVQQCNRVIFQQALTEPKYAGMGTTLTAAMVVKGNLFSAHVGDSRLYLFRQGKLHLLTRDHSLVEEMVAEGLVTREEAQNHPRRHILTRAIGTDENVAVDTSVCALEPKDLLLLCTDGITSLINDGEITEVLKQNTVLCKQGQALMDLANSRGGEDNITIILVQV